MQAETITVNGEPRPYRPQTVRELLIDCGIDPERPAVAVALNGAIALRGDWAALALRPGDRIEIVRPLGGG